MEWTQVPGQRDEQQRHERLVHTGLCSELHYGAPSSRTYDGGDPSGTRSQTLTASSVKFKVEEDTTVDTETGHTTEKIAWLAIEGNGYLTTASGASVTKSYEGYALRKDGELTFLLKDHLGSTHKAIDPAGNAITTLLYHPWGEVRHQSGTLPTDKTYTGQRTHLDDFGLMFYKARWYDPYLNHFTQPDSIIPDHYNPTDWNRYAYVRYNAVNFSDPSGHWPFNSEWWNPFSYETLTISFDGIAKEIAGLEVGIEVNINMKAIREFDVANMEASINTKFDGSIGLSAEGAGLISITGSNGKVADQVGITTILHDGISGNASGCFEVCVGMGATYDLEQDELSSITWSLGLGVGADLSVDIVGGSDVIYTEQGTWQIPFVNREFVEKVINDWTRPTKTKSGFD